MHAAPQPSSPCVLWGRSRTASIAGGLGQRMGTGPAEHRTNSSSSSQVHLQFSDVQLASLPESDLQGGTCTACSRIQETEQHRGCCCCCAHPEQLFQAVDLPDAFARGPEHTPRHRGNSPGRQPLPGNVSCQYAVWKVLVHACMHACAPPAAAWRQKHYWAVALPRHVSYNCW